MANRAIVGAVFAVLAATGAALAQSTLEGEVYVQHSLERREAVPNAFVVAKAGPELEIVATARADSSGRYRLTGLPEGRFAFGVEAQGYYVVQAGEVASETIHRACPASGDCGRIDFELARAAVVEGWTTDEFGEAQQGVDLQLTLIDREESTPAPRNRRRPDQFSVSDDRGYFRFWGLKPGRYALQADPRPSFMPGEVAPSSVRQEIEIPPGSESVQVQLSLGGAKEQFTVSGEVVGVAASAGVGAISVQTLSDERRFVLSFALQDGKFTTAPLAKGEYLFQFRDFGGDRNAKSISLGTLVVDRDLVGVKLSPAASAGVRGRVAFEDAPSRDLIIAFRLKDPGKTYNDYAEAKGPRFNFEIHALPPGEYEADVSDRDGYYLIEPIVFRVTAGSVVEIRPRASNQRSTVRGRVRVQAGDERSPGAFWTVSVRGERGSRSTQADESGVFVLDGLIPGRYEIASWKTVGGAAGPSDPWAGAEIRSVTLEPGFDVEIDLTVKP